MSATGCPDLRDVRLLEHLAFNAWPALRTLVQDDWILRFADGYTKRANSVSALAARRGTPSALLEGRIRDAEAVYARQGSPCLFRISPLMDPQIIPLLQAQGWNAFEESIVMTADLAAGATMPAGVNVATMRDESWSRGYMTFNRVPTQRQAIHDRMLDAIVPQPGFATSLDDAGAPAAFGLGVVERGHVGLFDIVTDPARRRSGHGGRIVNGLLAWACAIGAVRAYLQVTAANAPAITLYGRLGFREAYRYRYLAPPA